MTKLVWEDHESVPVLRFDGPESLNAFSLHNYHALQEALDLFANHPRWTALILTGSGRAFSSGHNVVEGRGTEMSDENLRTHVQLLQTITRQMLSIPKLMIAAVNGPAVGFGAEITLACDLRFASASAYFLFPELAIGLYFTNGTLELLPTLAGNAKACELLLGGQRWPAEEALKSGYLNRIVAEADLVKTARELALRAHATPGPGVESTLRFLRQRRRAAVEASLDYEVETGFEIHRAARDCATLGDPRNP